VYSLARLPLAVISTSVGRRPLREFDARKVAMVAFVSQKSLT
jgi:hypothetical protein